jgi:hypothetical protein
MAEKRIGRKNKIGRKKLAGTKWPKYWPPHLPHRPVCKKNENNGKNIFFVLYIMFRAYFSTIPQ